jgi:predicted nucleic acid-binding protein
MNRPGVLLDAGPIAALLSRSDANHERAKSLFRSCAPPLRSCEAVLAEACHLLRRIHRTAPAEALALARQGVYEIALSLEDDLPNVERLMRKYADRPMSLADACLVRMAERHQEARILTFDADFHVYRWAGSRKFQIV